MGRRKRIDPERVLAALAEDLVEVEASRRRALGAVALVIAPFALAIGWLFHAEHHARVPPVLIVGALVITLVATWAQKGFAARYKALVFARLVRALDDGLRYDPVRGIEQAALLASRIATAPIDDYKAEDLVEGPDWRASEVYATRGVGRNHYTLFKGLYVELARAEALPGHVVVVRDTTERYLGVLGVKLQQQSTARGELVHFDDAAFEAAFSVYASDPRLAERVLTRPLRERLTELAAARPAGLAFSLYGDKLAVGVWRLAGLFEPSMLTRVDDPRQLGAFLDDLEFALGLPEVLGLEGDER